MICTHETHHSCSRLVIRNLASSGFLRNTLSVSCVRFPTKSIYLIHKSDGSKTLSSLENCLGFPGAIRSIRLRLVGTGCKSACLPSLHLRETLSYLATMFRNRVSIHVASFTEGRRYPSIARSSVHGLAVFHSIMDTSRSRNSSTVVPIEEESLSSYDPAKYFPVKIGDVLHDQYSVKVKLGFGRSSTTWLCQDKRYIIAK
jgi:hypothetical protein